MNLTGIPAFLESWAPRPADYLAVIFKAFYLKNMDLISYVNKYSSVWKNVEYETRFASILDFPFEIKPHEFISYANDDLELDDKRGLISALKNAKSAIDCQIDAIIKVLGLKKVRNFPQKAEQITQLGLLAPRILKKIVSMRNRLEHDFALPDKNAVEDAVDVSTLFVEITNRIFRYFDTEFVVGELEHNPIIDLEKGTYIHFVFDEKGYFYEVAGKLNGEIVFTEKFSNNSKLYYPILRMSILCDIYQSSANHEKAVLDFLSNVKNISQ